MAQKGNKVTGMAPKGRWRFSTLAITALLSSAVTPANGLIRSRPGKQDKPEVPSHLSSLLPPVGAFSSPVKIGSLAHNSAADTDQTVPHNPTKEAKEASGKAAGEAPINYHGGPVMLKPKVVMIYYTNELVSAASATNWVSYANTFVDNLGASSRWAPSMNYFEKTKGTKKFVGEITLKGSFLVSVSSGLTYLAEHQLRANLEAWFKSGSIAPDVGTIYTFATVPGSKLYIEKGYCTSWCAYHYYYHSKFAKAEIKYAMVPVPDACESGCIAPIYNGTYKSPTGSSAYDGFFSALYHELAEAATDPELDAWYDKYGEENADKCAWTYGAWSHGKNSSGYAYQYNAVVGGQPFILQQAYDRVKQSCVQ